MNSIMRVTLAQKCLHHIQSSKPTNIPILARRTIIPLINCLWGLSLIRLALGFSVTYIIRSASSQSGNWAGKYSCKIKTIRYSKKKLSAIAERYVRSVRPDCWVCNTNSEITYNTVDTVSDSEASAKIISWDINILKHLLWLFW